MSVVHIFKNLPQNNSLFPINIFKHVILVVIISPDHQRPNQSPNMVKGEKKQKQCWNQMYTGQIKSLRRYQPKLLFSIASLLFSYCSPTGNSEIIEKFGNSSTKSTSCHSLRHECCPTMSYWKSREALLKGQYGSLVLNKANNVCTMYIPKSERESEAQTVLQVRVRLGFFIQLVTCTRKYFIT